MQGARAREAGVVICGGVGFDVVPTDCVAAAVKAALPDATELALGFQTPLRLSPGTLKAVFPVVIAAVRSSHYLRPVLAPLRSSHF